MESVKIKVSAAKAQEIADFYGAEIITDAKRPYDLFQVVTPDKVQVKGYRTKNPNVFTIVFSGGQKAVLEAQIFVADPAAIVTSSQAQFADVGEQIGSDEVGVGDFFGPMVATAVYFQPDQLELLNTLNVRDSKKLTDAHMMEIGPKLMEKFESVTIGYTPDKLSDLVAKGISTHRALVKLHNHAHMLLKKKYGLSDDITVFVDQFEPAPIYRRYAGDQLIANPIIFSTKGESHYPSVAIASVIARYRFLLYWDRMEKDLGMTISKGATRDADRSFQESIARNGLEKTLHYVKRFFRNASKYQNTESE